MKLVRNGGAHRSLTGASSTQWWFGKGHGRSIYTTEIGKHYKSEPLPPTPYRHFWHINLEAQNFYGVLLNLCKESIQQALQHLLHLRSWGQSSEHVVGPVILQLTVTVREQPETLSTMQ